MPKIILSQVLCKNDKCYQFVTESFMKEHPTLKYKIGYSEQEVQELKDKLQEYESKNNIFGRDVLIRNLQKENQELKEYIQKLSDKKKLQDDKELLELMKTKIRGQK